MIVTQPLDLMKTISREQLSRDMGFVHSFQLGSILESGGVGTPLYGLYRYVRPQRVWFFSRFGHK